MEKIKTKTKILYVTLELMALKGYDGVSVRDIAAGLGIKESSLYKHYKSKQHIFESLLFEMNEKYKIAIAELNFAQAADAGKPLQIRSAAQRMDELTKLCMGLLNYFLKGEYAGSFRRVLTMEQYKSENAHMLYQEYFFSVPLASFSDVFKTLLSRGEIPYNDPDFLSLQLYSPIFVLLCRCDDNEGLTEMAMQVLLQHVNDFGKQYCRA